MKSSLAFKSLNLYFAYSLIFFGSTLIANAQTPTADSTAAQILLPNGWSLSPAGKSLPLGDLPLNMQISPSKKYLAVTNNGQGTHTIQLFDIQNEVLLDQVVIAKSWYGLAFSKNNKQLYVSGGNDNTILNYPVLNNKLAAADTIRLGKGWPEEKISPAGIALDDAKNLLYTVTKEDSALYVVNLVSKKVLKKVKLGFEAYSCVLSPNKKELYISLWGGDKIAIVNTITHKIVGTVNTESHPNEIILNKSGKILLVANANDNSVSVIDIVNRKVMEVISTTLFPTKLTGSTTNGLALSEDEKTLYIANADNNCLAVFDFANPGKSISKGFIPTGWYPTCVRTLGNKILVANGKGLTSKANPRGPQPTYKTDESAVHSGIKKSEVQYIGALFKGSLSIIPAPGAQVLQNYSKQVYNNIPSASKKIAANIPSGNPIPVAGSKVSPIKYVFYVIKENRTYDQVFGDIKAGNGDSTLCIFPEKITPNHHALAKEFVLLDNFYTDAEVSADGHNWSMAAYATDYTEKTWVSSYSKRGGTYDYEGSRKIAYPRDGYIWDYCKRAGVSYRTYGEFADHFKANLSSLQGHFAPTYPGYNLDIKDIDRIKIWQKDFDSLNAINSVPQFNSIRIGNDHTSGQRKGKLSPFAAMGDNDLALGMLVEHISKSNIWKESAIFVLEDDAQNGSDHIDAHRSPALVISPYTKRGKVINTMYSTSGMLRTMELILGLPAMSQYDSLAMPFYDCFDRNANYETYTAKPANVNLEEKNIASNRSAERSEQWDFSREDRAPDLDLNEVVWKFVKGEDSEMPAPRRSAFLKLEPKSEEDDD